MSEQRIIIVDSDSAFRCSASERLAASGYRVDGAADLSAALETLTTDPHALLIVGLEPEKPFEIEGLRRLLNQTPKITVIVLSDPAAADAAATLFAAGANAWLTKPVHPDVLQSALDRALEHRRLGDELRELRSALDRKYGFENIIGRSDGLLHVMDTARRAAETDAPVLVRGEAGTGKELLATAIHFNGSRKNGAFVPFYCSAAGTQAEIELFGVRTGTRAPGRFNEAAGGTLFLDEISELPMQAQTRLLKAIQGLQKSDNLKPVARIIAATERNLVAMVEDETFREDLYYKLAVIPLELPPLRERAEDVPALVRHFFAVAKQKYGRADIALPDSLVPLFSAYRWPGNVEELEQVVDRMVGFGRSSQITLTDLPDFLRRERIETDVLHLDLPPQGFSLEAVEKTLILRALKKFNWNQSRAARYLDLSRKTLIYRMEKFGLRNLSMETLHSSDHDAHVSS